MAIENIIYAKSNLYGAFGLYANSSMSSWSGNNEIPTKQEINDTGLIMVDTSVNSYTNNQLVRYSDIVKGQYVETKWSFYKFCSYTGVFARSSNITQKIESDTYDYSSDGFASLILGGNTSITASSVGVSGLGTTFKAYECFGFRIELETRTCDEKPTDTPWFAAAGNINVTLTISSSTVGTFFGTKTSNYAGKVITFTIPVSDFAWSKIT